MLSAQYHGAPPNYKHGIRPLSPHKRSGGCPKLSTHKFGSVWGEPAWLNEGERQAATRAISIGPMFGDLFG